MFDKSINAMERTSISLVGFLFFMTIFTLSRWLPVAGGMLVFVIAWGIAVVDWIFALDEDKRRNR